MSVNRRDFLRKAAGVSAATLASTLAEAKPQVRAVENLLPSPALSGIEHVVVVMMENRSFDHLLGWMPNANGRQAGLSYPDTNGNLQPTHRLNYYVGCSHPDPDHSYAGGRSEYDGGKMDGWLRTSTNDSFSIGYYEEADLPLFGTLATNFTTLNNYFPSILSSTFPNRVFQHAAQTDRLDNSLDISTLPTIWDRLLAAGVSCRYYYSNVPFLALWGLKYIGISSLYSQFLSDAASGNLPAVSFVDPWFTILDDGTGNDDHPHADLRINSLLYDHTSVLKMIEWRWNLEPLTARDASDEIANLAGALNFATPDLSMPPLPVIPEPAWDPCTIFDIFGSLDTTATTASPQTSARALALAQQMHNRGQDNETYDFYLLLKSEHMQGWTIPENLKEK